MVYIVTVTAVYDHGCVGVFSQLEDAQEHVRRLWLESDGHHGFRIEQVPVDFPLATDTAGWRSKPRPPTPIPRVEMVPWSDDRRWTERT